MPAFDNGTKDVYYGIRDKTRIIADQHANLGRTMNSSIVQHLHKVRVEIKAHIKVHNGRLPKASQVINDMFQNIQNDTGKLAISVAKERELSARYIADLANSVSFYKNTPMKITVRGDPYALVFLSET
jgi:hypothetical protein